MDTPHQQAIILVLKTSVFVLGSAVGFRLDSLLKLTDTRARNTRMTLMHYLCKVLADKLPELLDFSKDLNSLEPASKVQLKYLAEEMQTISKGLEKVVQELSTAENDGPVSEKFRIVRFRGGNIIKKRSIWDVLCWLQARHVDEHK
ncbi:putative formin, FH2 domain-containing protein [Helianthus anomalus]